MDLKKQYIKTVEMWRSKYFERTNKKLSNAELAKILNISREHFQRLIGENYPVDKDHMDKLHYKFIEWQNAAIEELDREFEIQKGIFKRMPKTVIDPTKEGVIFVPIAAQANYSQHYTEPLFINQLERVYIPGFPYRGDRYRIFEVAGQSMEPTFKEGYYVVTEQVEPSYWHQVADFYVYVIVTRDQVMLKRVYKKSPTEWVLISDNEDFHPQIPLPVSEIKEVWYVKRKIDWEMPPPKRFEIKA